MIVKFSNNFRVVCRFDFTFYNQLQLFLLFPVPFLFILLPLKRTGRGRVKNEKKRGKGIENKQQKKHVTLLLTASICCISVVQLEQNVRYVRISRHLDLNTQLNCFSCSTILGQKALRASS
ncbi:hypothetical protein BpHYR1_041320 [Brachionus plicatilis]|uniref:Uncharacterized protein n=1 Tax=Brachionus plicatilis TaxID=10195 RepID=A0A3M7Q418_BRAPC|nr:hypothetical protein BpHYR1_041320 [Brachionus plicatilis]